MAAVLGGMTVLQLAQLAEALGGGAVALVKLHEELKIHGAEDRDSVPIDKAALIIDTMRRVYNVAPQDPAQDFITNTLGK